MTTVDVAAATTTSPPATADAPSWTVRSVVIGVGVVCAGALLGGFAGMVVAAAGIWVALRRSVGTVAVTAIGTLAVAAAATALPTISAGRNFEFGFVARRNVAAICGQFAGILAFVAVVAYADIERVGAPVWTSRRRPHLSLRGRDKGALGWGVAHAAVVIAAAAIRIHGAPRTLRPGYRELALNLRLEAGYVNGKLDHAHPSAFHAPLAPVIAAFAPGAPGLPLVIASTLTVLAVIVLARRLFGNGPAFAAGVAAAALPSLWGQQLPEALAALAVAAAVIWAYPPLLTVRRATVAGACLAAAALARPEALLVLPVVVAWPLLNGRRRAAPVLIVVVAIVGLWPWELFVHQRFGGWVPTTSVGTTLRGANAPSTLRGPLIGEFDPSAVPTGATERSADHAGRKQALRTLSDHPGRLASLLGARLLRGWDLWSPSRARRARAVRGLTLPGGAIGVAAEAGAFAIWVVSAITWRRQWRELFPLFVIPILFTVVTLLTYGDRGLRAWAAPMVALSVGAFAVAFLRRGGRRDLPLVWAVDDELVVSSNTDLDR